MRADEGVERRSNGADGARRPHRRRPPPLLLLLLLLVVLALSATLAARASEKQPDQHEEQRRRGELTGEGVDELVERFLALVSRAASLGGDGGGGPEGEGGDATTTTPTPQPQPQQPLDPSVEALLSRLLDEVLPDDAPEELRARAAQAMGVAAPWPPRPTTTTPANAAQPPATHRRRALLQNATPLSPIIAPASFLTVDRGGRFGGWSQAFQLAFSNVFDFFLRGGLGFLVPIIGDTLAPLRRYNWVRDTGMAIDAPFDNVINANYFPLPQTTADLTALLLRLLAPWCAAEKATPGYQVLGALRGAVAELELVPWSCDIVPANPEDAAKDQEAMFENLIAATINKKKKSRWQHGDADDADARAAPPLPSSLGARQKIAWDTCVPSKLVLRLKPATFNGPYFSAASYTAAACAFAQPFGLGSTFTLGLDTAAIALKLSRIGVDITPTIVQFEGSGRFFPWIAAEIANNATLPPREVAFTSASNRTTGS